MPHKGSFHGKRVFLGGLYFRENGAKKAFGAIVLNERELLTMHILKNKLASFKKGIQYAGWQNFVIILIVDFES